MKGNGPVYWLNESSKYFTLSEFFNKSLIDVYIDVTEDMMIYFDPVWLRHLSQSDLSFSTRYDEEIRLGFNFETEDIKSFLKWKDRDNKLELLFK